MRNFSLYALVSVVLLSAVFVNARSTSITESTCSTLGYSVQYLGVVYDTTAHTTIFTYSVTQQSGQGFKDISHWMLMPPCTLSGFTLAPGSQWKNSTTGSCDGSTGKCGFKWDFGQNAPTVTYTFVLKGYASAGPIEYLVKGGTKYCIGATTGPICNNWIPPPAACASPPDFTTECSNTDALAVPTGNGLIFVKDIRTDGACANQYTITRVWNATDLQSTCSQTIHVVDTTAPTLEFLHNAQPYVGLTCFADMPAWPNVTAHDECDGSVTVNEPCVEETTTSCPNKFYLRTWTAVDACGNSKCITQTLAFLDHDAPVFTGVPQDSSKECDGNPVEPDYSNSSSVTDGCDCITQVAGKNYTYDVTRYPGACPNTYDAVYNWVATDCCGNTASATSTFYVSDTIAPQIDINVAEPNATFECDQVPENFPAHTWDVCMQNSPDYHVNETRNNGSCPFRYVLTRVYTTIDDCGNVNTTVSVITVTDNTKPQWDQSSLPPANVDFECGNIQEEENPTATDKCGSATVTRMPDSSPVPTDCPNQYTFVRTWNATDSCGNWITYTQNVHISDSFKPHIDPASVPADATYQCSFDVPAQPNVTLAACQPKDCQQRNFVDFAGHVADPSSFFSACGAKIVSFHSQTQAGPVTDASKLIGNHKFGLRIASITGGSLVSTNNDNQNAPLNGAPHALTLHNVNNDSIAITFSQHVFRVGVAILTDPTTVAVSVQLSNAGQSVGSPIVMVGATSLVGGVRKDYAVESVLPFDTITFLSSDYLVMLDNLRFETGNDCIDCSQTVTQTKDEPEPVLSCNNNYTLVRTWTLTDCNGNSDVAVQTITVQDNTKPKLDQPADHTYTCDDIANYETVHMSDNCNCPCSAASPKDCPVSERDCKPVIHDWKRVDGECPFRYKVVHTWNTTDSCGNSASVSATITVTDDSLPNFIDGPADVNVECDNLPVKPAVHANDTCGAVTVDASPADSRTNSNKCNNKYTLKRFWIAEDQCHNKKTFTQTINVDDNTKPTLTGVPANTDVSCENVPDPAEVCVTDNCGGIALDYTQTRHNSSVCTAPDHILYTLTRVWTATDNCGNKQSATQIIRVYDRVDPTLNPSTHNPEEQSCDAIDIPANPTVHDTCSAVHLEHHHTTDPTDCAQDYTLNRNFRAVDFCGNDAWLNYTIHVYDTTKPEFLVTPADATKDCVNPDVVPPTYSDNCDANPILSGPAVQNQIDTCPNGRTFERVWTLKDHCNNANSYTQFVTVQDKDKPTWTWTPDATKSYECVPLAPEKPTATDNCGGFVNVTMVETNSSTCAYNGTLTRTWTATDLCGNFETFVQTVNIFDNSLPTLSPVDPEVTYDCTPLPPPKVCASDNCLGVTLTYKQEIQNKDCDRTYDILRTWTATDMCGQFTTMTQLVHVKDDTKPVFTPSSHVDTSVECGPVQEVPPALSDSCDQNPTKQNKSYFTPGACADDWYYHVSYYGFDSCGNDAWYNYTVHHYDNSQPTVTWEPAAPQSHVQFTCANLPDAPEATPSDNCGHGSVSYSNVTTPGSCPYNFKDERTWVVNDRCDNKFTVTQTAQGVFIVPPQFDDPPANKNRKCDTQEPILPLTGADACTNNYTAVLDQHFNTSGSCDGQYDQTRVWILTDVCTLKATHTQIISYYDDINPVLTVPANRTVNNECVEVPIDDATVTDSCSTPSKTPYRFNHSTECAYRFVSYIEWTAKDKCDNTVVKTQEVAYTWNNNPKLNNLPLQDMTVQCYEVPNVAPVTGSDGCGKNLVPDYKEVRVNGDCSNRYTLYRRWIVTDHCGLTDSFTQTIHVKDDENPTLCDIPADVSVQCGFVPPVADVTATDKCNGVQLNFTEVKILGLDCCDYKLVRTWYATDDCGNSVSGVQNIVVKDDTFPILHDIPGDITCAACPFTLPEYNVTASKPPLATGFCLNTLIAASTCANTSVPAEAQTNALTIGSNTVTFDVSAGTYIEFLVGSASFTAELKPHGGVSPPTWALSLNLNNALNYSDLPSGYQAIRDLNSDCYDTEPSSNDPTKVHPRNWWFYQQITGTLTHANTTLTLTTDNSRLSQVGVGANGRNTGYGLVLYGTATNSEGNSQGFELHLDLSLDGQNGCTFDKTLFPSLECNDPLEVDFVSTKVPGRCPGDYTLLNQWCVTDDARHTVCANQTITVCDTIAPEFHGVPAHVDISCEEEVPEADVSVTDACDETPDLWFNDSREDGYCDNTYTIHRTYHTVDACGNKNSATYPINVSDKKNPVISGVPLLDADANCDAVPILPVVCVSDNCAGTNLTYTVTRTNSTDYPLCTSKYDLLRKWKAFDDCSNPDDDWYTVRIHNPDLPEFDNVPTEVSLECKSALPTAHPTADQTCEGDVTALITNTTWSSTPTCPNIFKTIITWHVTDHCGNTAVPVSQTVHFQDTTVPTWDQSALPQDENVTCDNIPAAVVLTAHDNCDKVDVTFHETNRDHLCNNDYKIQRTWVAKDCSNNAITHIQVLHVKDNSDPVLTFTPPLADVTVNCKAIPELPEACVTDNCAGVTAYDDEVRVNTAPNTKDTCNQFTLNRTWVAKDDCGLTATASYIITVNDVVAPVCDNAPPDATKECTDSWSDLVMSACLD
jgi:hypothetical protein